MKEIGFPYLKGGKQTNVSIPYPICYEKGKPNVCTKEAQKYYVLDVDIKDAPEAMAFGLSNRRQKSIPGAGDSMLEVPVV